MKTINNHLILVSDDFTDLVYINPKVNISLGESVKYNGSDMKVCVSGCNKSVMAFTILKIKESNTINLDSIKDVVNGLVNEGLEINHILWK